MRTLGQGRNSNSWVHPYDRDTTRGEVFGGVSGESLHSKEMKGTVSITSCRCCGVTFGFPVSEEKQTPDFCAAHKWLERTKLLGHPLLEGVQYLDDGVTINGEKIRWSYLVKETDRGSALKYRDGIREWLKKRCEGQGFQPEVIATPEGVKTMDLQRLCRPKNVNGLVDYDELARILIKLDEIYVEVL